MGSGLNVVSRVPSVLSLAAKLRSIVVVVCVVSIAEKFPPTRTLPSDCIASVVTELLGEGWYEVSRVPSVLSRAM